MHNITLKSTKRTPGISGLENFREPGIRESRDPGIAIPNSNVFTFFSIHSVRSWRSFDVDVDLVSLRAQANPSMPASYIQFKTTLLTYK